MASEFFEPGAQRAARVSDLFARIAARYDFINDLQSFGLHRSWKREVARLAQVRPGDKALDVCCGTGDLVFAFLRENAQTVGIDFSAPMLRQARLRERTAGVRETKATGRARWVRGDAQHLPFHEASFDIVTVAYGLRNLADWKRGLSEMCRVAKPGGRLLVLDFAKPPNAVWRWMYFRYLHLFVPLLGLIFSGSAGAYAYILESLKHYPAQEGVALEMRALGLTKVRVELLLGGVMSINYAETPGSA